MKKVDDFFVPTWLVFAGLVTIFDGRNFKNVMKIEVSVPPCSSSLKYVMEKKFKAFDNNYFQVWRFKMFVAINFKLLTLLIQKHS